MALQGPSGGPCNRPARVPVPAIPDSLRVLYFRSEPGRARLFQSELSALSGPRGRDLVESSRGFVGAGGNLRDSRRTYLIPSSL